MSKSSRIDPGHGGRSVAEWIGKHPDQKVPDGVGLRIWRRQNGLCGLSGRKIAATDKKELHHIKELSAGGEHRETNLVWVLSDAHKIETKDQAGRRRKSDRVAKKHAGIRRPKGEIKSRSFEPAAEKSRSDRAGKIDKSALPPLARGGVSGCYRFKDA